MKKIITLAFTFIIAFLFSCRHDENLLPDVFIDKITFDGIGVRDTLTFQYKADKVWSVNWCTYVEGASTGCLSNYSELRYYNSFDKLDSVRGLWDINYQYENGLRKKIIAYYNNNYYSTTTFLEYAGIVPVKIKVEFASDEVTYMDLTFNSSGDLVRKVIKDGQGALLEDSQIQYSNIKNPLQGLQETVSYAVEFFDYDDFVFYYSKHLPEKIDNPVPTAPGHVVLQHSIEYNFRQDDSGRLVSASAFYHQINVHNISIRYAK